MGLISIGGIGSGLDTASIVEALVNAERAPKENSLNRQEVDVSVTLTGLGGLKASLEELRSAALDLSLSSNFNKRIVSVSDSDFFTATAASGANTGNYDIEVTALATGTIQESQIFTSGSSTTFGDGTLTFTLGSDTFDIAVTSTDTLTDIREAINSATENDFVAANLLNNVTDGIDTGSVINFSSSTTGTGNDLVISFTGDASLADLSDNLNESQTAGDASIEIDGLTATSSNNTFVDVIQDITINVNKIHSPGGTTDSLDVKLDTATPSNLIKGFVEAYNAYQEVIQQLGSADSTAPGLLLGDFTLRQVSSQIRNLFSDNVSSATGEFDSLSALGISTTQTGTLEIDTAVLDAAIESDFDKLDELFTGDDGFATKLRDLVNTYTGSSGVIKSREDSLNSQLSRITDDRLSLNLRIQSLQLRLTKQFATMDAIVAQFNSTQSFVTQQFENLPGFGGKKN